MIVTVAAALNDISAIKALKIGPIDLIQMRIVEYGMYALEVNAYVR